MNDVGVWCELHISLQKIIVSNILYCLELIRVLCVANTKKLEMQAKVAGFYCELKQNTQ